MAIFLFQIAHDMNDKETQTSNKQSGELRSAKEARYKSASHERLSNMEAVAVLDNIAPIVNSLTKGSARMTLRKPHEFFDDYIDGVITDCKLPYGTKANSPIKSRIPRIASEKLKLVLEDAKKMCDNFDRSISDDFKGLDEMVAGSVNANDSGFIAAINKKGGEIRSAQSGLHPHFEYMKKLRKSIDAVDANIDNMINGQYGPDSLRKISRAVDNLHANLRSDSLRLAVASLSRFNTCYEQIHAMDNAFKSDECNLSGKQDVVNVYNEERNNTLDKLDTLSKEIHNNRYINKSNNKYNNESYKTNSHAKIIADVNEKNINIVSKCRSLDMDRAKADIANIADSFSQYLMLSNLSSQISKAGISSHNIARISGNLKEVTKRAEISLDRYIDNAKETTTDASLAIDNSLQKLEDDRVIMVAEASKGLSADNRNARRANIAIVPYSSHDHKVINLPREKRFINKDESLQPIGGKSQIIDQTMSQASSREGRTHVEMYEASGASANKNTNDKSNQYNRGTGNSTKFLDRFKRAAINVYNKSICGSGSITR